MVFRFVVSFAWRLSFSFSLFLFDCETSDVLAARVRSYPMRLKCFDQ